MASATKFSYHRLKHEEEEGHVLEVDEIAERLMMMGRPRPCVRLKRVSVKKRFRVKVPSLRRLLRKKFKESQAHLGDLFAGNYMFIQVNPTTMKYCFEKSYGGLALNGLPSSRCSLSRNYM
ncbi:hypothetical protein ES319_D09G034700v1, partial [Gossypium barbadense]